ncbi:fumarylacetoacetate hydrolase family protein [Peribacillus sp. SCS-155]|uniref:fumarylacetoacetate hydrolase family protein n=1 Tax=Peribacillus sedimenti TaxID=3115297 RepID=UPI0039066EB5
MKLLSFYDSNEIKLGVKTEGGIVDVQSAAEKAGIPAPNTILEVITQGPEALASLKEIVAASKDPVPEEQVKYAPPIHNPGKIICVGANYRKHAEESGLPIPEYPVYFSKFINSLAGNRQNVEVPSFAQQVDYEVELVVVIGKPAKRVSPEQALDFVFGYAAGNDLSVRELQFRSNQWLYGKSLDGFAPLGPYIVTSDEVSNPQNLQLKCWVNGELRQDSNTADMIFPVARLISDLSQIMTLEPGDIIYTGTPEGVILGMQEKNWLKPGDEVVCEVEGLGRLITNLTQ